MNHISMVGSYVRYTPGPTGGGAANACEQQLAQIRSDSQAAMAALPASPAGSGASAPAAVRTEIAPLGGQLGTGLASAWHEVMDYFKQLLASVQTPATPATGPATSLASALAARSASQPLTLGAGTYAFNDFGSNPAHSAIGEANNQGADLPASVPGIAGAGIDRTVIEMAPHTSTHAKDIPTQDWTTNQFSLLRVSGSPNLHDFTLRATDQGHLYNGLHLYKTTNARVTNVKITGVPGNRNFPPGETFGINDYRTNNTVYKNLEVDGQGLGAAGYGANDSTNVTIENGYFHDNHYSAGATFWQTQNVTLVDCKAINNHGGLNFERVSGTVNIIRPTVKGTQNGTDISIGTDNTSAVYNIQDPVLAAGQKLRVRIGKVYLGKPTPQKRSDVHVFVNGVDRTADLVQWV